MTPIDYDVPYRPEIDGLRAVAVVAVVLFHAGLGCPGGFVGVDVFFVISGFLISSLIWKELDSGSFSFGRFWERRARRIVPAMVVVTIAVLCAGWFFLLPLDLRSLGRAAASQSSFAANIHYWLDSGYFAVDANEKPLLHTWSLAVEEQFYLIVPVWLFVTYSYPRFRRRNALLLILATLATISFALSVYGVAHHPSATFYLLPTRAWELLLGSIVALLPSIQAPAVLLEILVTLGTSLVVLPIFLYTSTTPFPGVAALLPCAGTALFIFASGLGGESRRTAVASVLSLRPVVFLGLISYSLYLWHWPPLAFSNYLYFQPLTLANRLSMVILGFLASVLSWKYVETPFRQRKLGDSRKSIFTLAGFGLLIVFLAGFVCVVEDGFTGRFSSRLEEIANARLDFAFSNDLTERDLHAGNLVDLGVSSSRRPTIFVWGDSHAMAALPALDAFLMEKGLKGLAATHSSTPPVLNWFKVLPSSLGKDSIAYNRAVLCVIRQRRIPEVILIANWAGYANEPESARIFNQALLNTVRRLRQIGARPWIFLDVPSQTFDVPRALARAQITHENVSSRTSIPSVRNELERYDPGIIAALRRAGALVLDPKPRFLNHTLGRYIIEDQGVVLYRDDSHLTTAGAKRILLPFFRESLRVVDDSGL